MNLNQLKTNDLNYKRFLYYCKNIKKVDVVEDNLSIFEYSTFLFYYYDSIRYFKLLEEELRKQKELINKINVNKKVIKPNTIRRLELDE